MVFWVLLEMGEPLNPEPLNLQTLNPEPLNLSTVILLFP